MFSGLTVGAVIAWLVTNVLPIILDSGFKAFNAANAQSQNRADQVDLGATTVTAKVNQEGADAERRASDAMVNTGDLDDLLAGLSTGKF